MSDVLKASFSIIWSLNGLFPQWIFQFPACHVQTFSHWTTVLHQFQEPVRSSRKTTIMCENVAFLFFCYLFKTHGMPTGLSYFRTDCRLSINLVTQFSEALSLIYQHLLLWKKDFCLIRFSKAWLELHFFPPTKINTDHHGPSRKKKSRFNWAAAHGARFFWTPQMDRVYIKGLRFGPPELLDHCWMFRVDPWRRHEMRENTEGSNGNCLDLLLTKYITPSCNLKNVQIQTHH